MDRVQAGDNLNATYHLQNLTETKAFTILPLIVSELFRNYLMIVLRTKHVGSWYANKRYIYICVRDNGLRHCTSDRKITCSMVSLGFFYWIFPSGRILAVASTYIVNEYQWNLRGGRGEGGKGRRPVRRLTILPLKCPDCLEILGASWALRACAGLYRDTFTFIFVYCDGM